MRDWKRDKAWADRYLPEIERVVKLMAHKIISVEVSTPEEDQFRATDYVVRAETGNIACRVRRWSKWHRWHDFTLRAWRPSGVQTELSKIKEGYGDWYLYAWANTAHGFGAWIFVDLSILRGTSLLDNAPETMNPDRSSSFIHLEILDLCQHGCLCGYGGAASQLIESLYA